MKRSKDGPLLCRWFGHSWVYSGGKSWDRKTRRKIWVRTRWCRRSRCGAHEIVEPREHVA